MRALLGRSLRRDAALTQGGHQRPPTRMMAMSRPRTSMPIVPNLYPGPEGRIRGGRPRSAPAKAAASGGREASGRRRSNGVLRRGDDAAVVSRRALDEKAGAALERVAPDAGEDGKHRARSVEKDGDTLGAHAGAPAGPEAAFGHPIRRGRVEVTQASVLGPPPAVDVEQARRQAAARARFAVEPAVARRQQGEREMDGAKLAVLDQEGRGVAA